MRRGVWLVVGLLGLAACGGGGGGPQPGVPDQLALTTFQSADVAVGQPIFALNSPNQGLDGPNAQTLASPGMPSRGPFYLPDVSNHRVLGYDQLPFLNHAGANFVLGQPALGFDFPGVGATALRNPLCVRVAGDRLYVSDSGNHRVLIWRGLPTANAAPADIALGQPDLDSDHPGADAAGLRDPAGLAVGGGRVLVADRANHRVLVWLTQPDGHGAAADLVLGQAGFDGTLPNRGLPPGPGTMREPSAVWSDGVRVVVADRGNHRVLVWRTFPTRTGQPADYVLGQEALEEATPRLGARGLFRPSDVASNGSQLVVADAGNHRVLVWHAFPDSTAAPADAVLGQISFDLGAANDDDGDGRSDRAPSARTLSSADGVLTVQIQGGVLCVGDTGNHRVLVFRTP